VFALHDTCNGWRGTTGWQVETTREA